MSGRRAKGQGRRGALPPVAMRRRPPEYLDQDDGAGARALAEVKR